MKPKDLRQDPRFLNSQNKIKEYMTLVDEELDFIRSITDKNFAPYINLNNTISFEIK